MLILFLLVLLMAFAMVVFEVEEIDDFYSYEMLRDQAGKYKGKIILYKKKK